MGYTEYYTAKTKPRSLNILLITKNILGMS